MHVDLTIVKDEIEIEETKIKLEVDSDSDLQPYSDAMEFSSNNALQILEEGSDMITVAVNEQQSEDERKFIDSLESFDQHQLFASTNPIVCSICEQSFDSDLALRKHKRQSGACFATCQQYKCTFCALNLKSQIQLDAHNIQHQRNKHFCRYRCGAFFDTLDQCMEHEFRGHGGRRNEEREMRCRLCDIHFGDKERLLKHMDSYRYETHFVCSLCRCQFGTRRGLLMHRSKSKNSCGRVKFIEELNEACELIATEIPRGKRRRPMPATLAAELTKCFKLDQQQPASDIEIKLEPIDINPADAIKTEPLEEQELNNNNTAGYSNKYSLGIPPKIKLRLPALKKLNEAEIAALPAAASAPGIKLRSIAALQSVPAAPLPALQPKFATPPNILKTLPSNCMVIKLPPHIKIVKIPHTTADGNVVNNATIVKLNNSSINNNNTTASNNNSCSTVTPPKSPETVDLNSQALDRSAFLRWQGFKYIDNLPESRKLIEELQSKIRNIEKTMPLPGSVLQPPKGSKGSSGVGTAASFASAVKNKESMLVLLSMSEVNKLQEQEAQPGCRFELRCPRCPLAYEDVPAFHNHLIAVHKMSPANIELLKVQVRPYNPLKNKAPSMPPTEVPKATAPEWPVASIEATSAARIEQVDTTAAPTDSDDIQSAISTPSSENKKALLQALGDEKVLRPYECNVCHKRFTTSSVLSCHRMIHTGELPHKCNCCGKGFRTSGQVRVHMRRHTGEKPFQCKVCSLAFTHRETLISHLSRHIGMKRYKCYGCDKYFVVVSGLRAHRRLRPDTCGKVKFTARAHGPRVRVIRGEVVFEEHPEYNGYLRSEDPLAILSEIKQPSPEAAVDCGS